MRTTMRTHHKATVLAAAAVTALSLGLTACGGDTGTGAKDAGSASSSHSEQATGAADTGTDTGTADGTSDAADTADGSTAGGSTSGGVSEASATGGKGSTSGNGSTGGKTAAKASAKTSTKTAAKAPACAYGDIRITAAKADEVPTEHITLTATNVSGRSCTLLQYPLIAFGDIQTAKDVPAVAKSKPAAPVVLKPGAPAYANVRVALGGVGEGNKVVKSFNVNLFAADGPAEGSIVVKAPAGGLAVDETAAKTGYWTHELRNGADEF
ncbi:DUF4232 domain-containing protein [Streptomyces gardneri]|uniref:DUF4232 domain-containing protein n=1 Tax=Streptomyces gardneri TaxID=66892 RepID=A0A4Y3RYS4_9ACTN|nr:DUF4232 domain-containing protein [Streptomyces gardneri]GEB61937.1 hypothetical protein SGA01_75420 [Streptomyces gardneri]GHG86861.1 hypothetical protein GCM10017674_12070 [Streptomyces gardneri]